MVYMKLAKREKNNPLIWKGEKIMTNKFTHDFTGKVVAITGAGGILCSKFAAAFAEAGAKVALLDLTKKRHKVMPMKLLPMAALLKGINVMF